MVGIRGRAARVRAGRFAAAAAGFAAVATLAGAAASRGAEAPAPLTIGASFSLTGGGNVYGPQQRRGAQLAVDEINDAGGVDGVPLKLVVRDDASVPARGKAVMRQLIQHDGAIAVLGPSLSLVAVAADPVADRLRTPVVAVSNTAEGIVGRCAYPCSWIWRDSLGEETAVPADIAEYELEQHPSTAAVLYVSNDKLGIDEGRIAAASFARARIKVVANRALPATGDLTAAVRAAVRTHPEVVFIGASFGARAVDAMRAARQAGFRGTFLGGNTLNSDTTARLAGALGTGARSGAAWYTGNDFPANSDFVTEYRQVYDAAPDQFAAQAYVGVKIVADALERGGVATSDASIADRRAALQRGLADVTLITPLGPFRFTSDHDVSQVVWVLSMDGSGGHRLAGFCDPDC
jgi:branched-chain amino acid transport system substrate-binding protein